MNNAREIYYYPKCFKLHFVSNIKGPKNYYIEDDELSVSYEGKPCAESPHEPPLDTNASLNCSKSPIIIIQITLV